MALLRGLAATVILLWAHATCAAPGLPAPVLKALQAADIPTSSIGAVIMEPGGRVLMEVNADASLNPASAMKLVTTYAALELLGPAYTWRTEVHAGGKVAPYGRLEGDLFLRGSGDPKLTMESLWMLLRDVRARGIRDITGDLVLDRSAFAIQDIDPGAFDGDPTRPYNVGPDATLLNFNAMRLTFVPDLAAGVVRIYPEPPLADVRIENTLTLGNGPCDAWPEKPAVDLVTFGLAFSGAYPVACGEKVKHFSVLPPVEYARALFEHLWRGVGGSFSGRVRQGQVPAASQPIASIESPPLVDVVRDINKNSNNVMARQVFLALGVRAGQPATLEGSQAAVATWLRTKGFAPEDVVLENGAGLSRNERIKPRTLATLLAAAWRSPLGPELAASLPLAGIDGTLKRRFTTSPALGRAHLKTGYLSNVRAMAGYVHGPDGRTLVLVSIINHPKAQQAAAVSEALVEWALTRSERPGCCGAR